MDILLAHIRTDDKLDGPCGPGKWGDLCEEHVLGQSMKKATYEAGDVSNKGRGNNRAPLVYSVPTYTQHANGSFYLGYPIPMMQSNHRISRPCDSITATDSSTEMTDISDDMTEADMTEDDVSDEDTLYVGRLTHYAGWQDASKNYGFIKVNAPIKKLTRLITFNPPPKYKRGDTVLFRIAPNKRGKDAWKAEIM